MLSGSQLFYQQKNALSRFQSCVTLSYHILLPGFSLQPPRQGRLFELSDPSYRGDLCQTMYCYLNETHLISLILVMMLVVLVLMVVLCTSMSSLW